MGRIIVVESEDGVRKEITEKLGAEGHSLAEFAAGAPALEAFRSGADVVLLSYSVTDIAPLELLRQFREIDSTCSVIAVSAPPDARLPALRAGAFYVTRPPASVDELSLLTQRAADTTRTLRKAQGVKAPVEPIAEPVLIGETQGMRNIKDTIRRLRSSPATTVLIAGESGSGKDTIARAIHLETQPGKPFVYISASVLPEASLDAELFGVEGGPGVEEQPGLLDRADGGTLFLDEIADMPLPLQTKLLRFLQEKTFRRVGATADRVSDARVIAATARDLHSAVRSGALRSELLYRLAVVTLEVPPLRERQADIPLLVRHFLGVLSNRVGRQLRGVTDRGMELLVEHSWPGNVRELGNVLEQAALLSEVEVLDAQQLSVLPGRASGVDYHLPWQGIDFRELERQIVQQALRHASGNQTRAASLLGMTRDQIRYRMAKFGMMSRDSVRSGTGAPRAA